LLTAHGLHRESLSFLSQESAVTVRRRASRACTPRPRLVRGVVGGIVPESTLAGIGLAIEVLLPFADASSRVRS
jgi:hypothetical protein